MKKTLSLIATLAIFCFSSASFAAEPLVDVDWVKANIGKPGIVFLEYRSPSAYKAAHVPGAVLTSYRKDKWRVTVKGVPGLLPEIPHLEKLLGKLGIGNQTHLVILPAGVGAAEMGVATRMYWTMKVLGHDEVSILDGGMKAYLKDKKNPVEKGVNKPVAAIFKANFRKEFLATADDVKVALKGGGTVFIDNRLTDNYLGINTPRSKVKRAGTLPGAKGVPGKWMTIDGGGAFRSAETLKQLYAAMGTPTEGDTITFCNTGHWASLGWFVNYEILGNKKTRMYDASLAEWSRDANNPMEQKVKITDAGS